MGTKQSLSLHYDDNLTGDICKDPSSQALNASHETMIIRDYHFNNTRRKSALKTLNHHHLFVELTLLFYLHDFRLREVPATEPEKEDAEEDLEDVSITERDDEKVEFGQEEDEDE